MFLGTERHWSWPSVAQGYIVFNGYATGNSLPDYLLGLASSFSQGSGGVRTYGHYKMASPYVEETWHVARRLTVSGGLRYSYMPWPTEQAGVIDDFNPATFNATQAPTINIGGTITSAAGSYNAANGIVLNGSNGVPLSLTTAHKSYWAPVVGFAWDVYGDGKTSLRGGYGLTYYETAGQGCDQGGCLGYPTLNAVNLSTSNFDDPAGAATAPTIPNENGEDLQGYRASHIHTYSVSLEQQFGTNWIASVAGAGSMQGAGSSSVNINQPGAVTVNSVAYNYKSLLWLCCRARQVRRQRAFQRGDAPFQRFQAPLKPLDRVGTIVHSSHPLVLGSGRSQSPAAAWCRFFSGHGGSSLVKHAIIQYRRNKDDFTIRQCHSQPVPAGDVPRALRSLSWGYGSIFLMYNQSPASTIPIAMREMAKPTRRRLRSTMASWPTFRSASAIFMPV